MLSNDPQQQNYYSYARNNPLVYLDPTGEYNIRTGEIEIGDTQAMIVDAVNEAYGIETNWQTIANVSFLPEEEQLGTLGNLEGQFTNVGTNYVADITDYLGKINIDRVQQAQNMLFAKPRLAWLYLPKNEWDLKNSDDPILGSWINKDGKIMRNYMAYLYNGDLIRYDAPGNINYGYVTRSIGMNVNSALRWANLAQLSFSFDNPGDSFYIRRGYYNY